MKRMDISEEINDESDHDDNSSRGYFTRAKRRRLSEKYEGREEPSTSGLYQIPEIGKRKNPIMHVPTEVLFLVFKYISYHELSAKVRLVNRRFKAVAEQMLNMAFQKKIKNTLDCLVKSTTDSLSYTTDDMEIKCLSKMLCLLEIIRYQYALVLVTIWRYVYNEFYRTNRACMYGGLIIDMHDQFVRKFSCCPNELYGPAILRDYSLPPEVTKIIQMSKTFCVHFDKINEESMQNSMIFSGCKIIDILDCAAYAQKTVHFELKVDDTYLARYSFYFKNSWFIQMPIPQVKEMDLGQKQRLMHMRLRRIVFAHNDMYLQQEQYERELGLRPNAQIPVRKPGNNVYTGYGDVEDTFFYYGVMNDVETLLTGATLYILEAYIQKFHLDEDNDEEDDDDLIQVQVEEPNAELNREHSEEDILYGLPYNGFKVDISVKCPLSYSPLKFLQSFSDEELKALKKKPATKGRYRLKYGERVVPENRDEEEYLPN